MSFPKEAFLQECTIQKRSVDFVKECLSYIHNLESNGFPVIFSLTHFAIELGLPSDDIKFILDHDRDNYSYFLLKKKMSGVKREIMAPREKLKFIQRWLNYNILQKVSFNKHIHGFIPESSTFNNAKVHEGSRYLLKIDLLKFFDCVTDKRVYGVFRSFGYSKNLSWDFAKICTTAHRKSYWESFEKNEKEVLIHLINDNCRILPQGAPTSPLLANIVASRIDKRIGKLAEKFNFNYTRYADDLCFSSNEIRNIPSIATITQIINNEGFFINSKKTSFTKAGMKQYVTGLSISNKVSISKNKRREIFTHLYFLRKYGQEQHLLRLQAKGVKHTNFKNWLLGHISYQYSIDAKVGKKMFDIYNLINWEIDINVSSIES